MVVPPIFGKLISLSKLNSLNDYFLVSMEEPWVIIRPKLKNPPTVLKFNKCMDLNYLENFYSEIKNIKNKKF